VKSYAFLFWAYNVVWIGIAGYLLCLAITFGLAVLAAVIARRV